MLQQSYQCYFMVENPEYETLLCLSPYVVFNITLVGDLLTRDLSNWKTVLMSTMEQMKP